MQLTSMLAIQRYLQLKPQLFLLNASHFINSPHHSIATRWKWEKRHNECDTSDKVLGSQHQLVLVASEATSMLGWVGRSTSALFWDSHSLTWPPQKSEAPWKYSIIYDSFRRTAAMKTRTSELENPAQNLCNWIFLGLWDLVPLLGDLGWMQRMGTLQSGSPSKASASFPLVTARHKTHPCFNTHLDLARLWSGLASFFFGCL